MTTMASRYSNYELSERFTTAASAISQELQFQKHQHRHMPEALKKIKENARHKLQEQEQSSYFLSTAGASTAATVTEADASVSNLIAVTKNSINTPKNYFVPLHVDCSVEYELPKQPKPPAGQRVEPLLMIHPCYFRKMESQRRSPFINNMPNSSRNGGMLVGVAFVSQGAKIEPAPASTLSLKRTSFRNNYNTRQNAPSHYGSIRSTEQPQLQNPQQHNLSIMPQHARYSEASSSKFLEHSSAAIRQTAIINRTDHQHVICSTQQTKNEINQQAEHLMQKSSSSNLAYNQFDQLTTVGAAVTSLIADKNPNDCFSGSLNNHCKVECSIATSSAALVKHDAMMSSNVGYLNNVASKNNTSLRIQMNKNSSNANNISLPSEKHNSIIVRNRSRNATSTCLVDKSKLPWNPKPNTTPSLFMTNQSPIATVPSNFQAGLDTSQTRTTKQQELQHHKYRKINDNNNKIVYKNNIITSSEKFRQYLRSHRLHPYLTEAPSRSDSTTLALSSESAMADRGDFQVLPQFTATKAVVDAVSTATSFQQHMQQISCYNVC